MVDSIQFHQNPRGGTPTTTTTTTTTTAAAAAPVSGHPNWVPHWSKISSKESGKVLECVCAVQGEDHHQAPTGKVLPGRIRKMRFGQQLGGVCGAIPPWGGWMYYFVFWSSLWNSAAHNHMCQLVACVSWDHLSTSAKSDFGPMCSDGPN